LSAYGHHFMERSKLGILGLKRCCCLLTLSLTLMVVPLQKVIAQAVRTDSVVSTGPIFFDLPAQGLESAIEAFSISSGWQVVYDSRLALDRRSVAVKGHVPPATALNRLLAGTGLTVEFMRADAAMLVPVTAGRQEGLQDHIAGAGSYHGRVQAGLKRAICASEQVSLREQRLAIGFWIGASAAVTRVELLGTTGDPAIDSSYRDLVRRLSFDQAPPAGFKQPVVVLITPDLLAQCGSAVALPAGVGR
jgi:hypothetical protein